ncbi:hypothetical protein HY087_02670, partial [Candidatus Gottesmanbacteria bacterium]|nr:hypothetical protein [Candidatus Gottesmanbacteria bacterium]
MLNPFKMLGDMNAMRKQAVAIQQALEAEKFEVWEGNNIRIVITGNQNVEVVEENGIAREDLKR